MEGEVGRVSLWPKIVLVPMYLFREHGMPDDITTHGVLSGIFNATASIG